MWWKAWNHCLKRNLSFSVLCPTLVVQCTRYMCPQEGYRTISMKLAGEHAVSHKPVFPADPCYRIPILLVLVLDPELVTYDTLDSLAFFSWKNDIEVNIVSFNFMTGFNYVPIIVKVTFLPLNSLAYLLLFFFLFFVGVKNEHETRTWWQVDFRVKISVETMLFTWGSHSLWKKVLPW